jgi:murein DD-endopeptidase MepM/ murein hydrolase activator NlpD
VAARRGERGPGGRRDEVLFELQIHPGDIRKRVRYLFVTRRQAVAAGVAAALWTVLVAGGLVTAPPVISTLVDIQEIRAQRADRDSQAEELERRAHELAQLADDTATLRLTIDQIAVLYDLPADAMVGQGGYPLPGAVGAAEAPGEDAPVEERLDHARHLETSVRESLSVADIFLGEIRDFERARSDQVRLMPSLSPLRGQDFTLTSPFGSRTNPFTGKPDRHAGLDMAARKGTPILAPADGEVLYAGRYSLQKSVAWWRYGNLVMLSHGDHFVTLFGHCDELKVETGDTVSRGDVIATVGNTGLSTNSHLHYEVRRKFDELAADGGDGMMPVDPRIYILDLRWDDQAQMLVQSRQAPAATDYQPLPPLLRR